MKKHKHVPECVGFNMAGSYPNPIGWWCRKCGAFARDINPLTLKKIWEYPIEPTSRCN